MSRGPRGKIGPSAVIAASRKDWVPMDRAPARRAWLVAALAPFAVRAVVRPWVRQAFAVWDYPVVIPILRRAHGVWDGAMAIAAFNRPDGRANHLSYLQFALSFGAVGDNPVGWQIARALLMLAAAVLLVAVARRPGAAPLAAPLRRPRRDGLLHFGAGNRGVAPPRGRAARRRAPAPSGAGRRRLRHDAVVALPRRAHRAARRGRDARQGGSGSLPPRARPACGLLGSGEGLSASGVRPPGAMARLAPPRGAGAGGVERSLGAPRRSERELCVAVRPSGRPERRSMDALSGDAPADPFFLGGHRDRALPRESHLPAAAHSWLRPPRERGAAAPRLVVVGARPALLSGQIGRASR